MNVLISRLTDDPLTTSDSNNDRDPLSSRYFFFWFQGGQLILHHLGHHSTPSRSIFSSTHKLSLEDTQLPTNAFLVITWTSVIRPALST